MTLSQPAPLLIYLDPPTGGLARLRGRRDGGRSSAPSWWAFAFGSAAAVAWFVVALGQTRVAMPLSGERLVGGRSHGSDLQMLETSERASLASADAKVRIYVIGPGPRVPE